MSAAVDPIERHLAALEQALRGGSRRARRELLQEVADHLEDAAEAYCRAGLGDREAAARAVADFGTVAEVAPGLRATLAVSASRRTSWILLATLGVQPFLWDGGLELAPADEVSAPPGGLYAVLDVGVELLGGALILAALLAVTAGSLGQRWWGCDPRRQRRAVRLTAWLALSSAVLLPGMGVAMLSLTGGPTAPLWAMLGLLMVAPMAAVSISARRCLAVT